MSGSAPPPPTLGVRTADDRGGIWHGEFYRPPLSVFQPSRAYGTLTREIRRYLTEEVPGRSFLISGHRGVGKTALVLRAVEDMKWDVIAEDRRAARQFRDPGTHPTGLQRPFLVKLNGSALLSNVTPPAAPDPKSGTATRSARPSNVTPSGDRTVEQALQQITIALYRAFAREVTECFSAHARNQAAGSVSAAGDLLELAGQLVLDLDLAPDLAILRDRWSRLGRLEDGVVWPTPEPGRPRWGAPRDQGIREIVALATANQAFQVCIGEYERKRTDKDAASQQQTASSEFKLDAKDLANKLMGSVAGLVAGAVLWPAGPATAVGAGLATTLISTMTLGWTKSRSQKGERGVDYTFVTKSNLQTLERDLPLVVERIRQAGLAPIFVIDELDKVQDAVNGIKNLIDRLKSLMTDFGFFCFLTDRDYYEQIEQAASAEAFPTEHTYFSHRLLLQYGPRDLASYLGDVLTIDGARLVEGRRGPGMPPSLARLSTWILATRVLHDGRLNTIQVIRNVTELQDSAARLTLSLDQVRSTLEYLLPVVVQLSVEIVLRRPSIRRRTETDPAFEQWAIEALYMISARWDEMGEVDVSEEGLCDYFAARHPALIKYLAARNSSLRDHIGKAELQLLVDAVQKLAELLADFGRVHDIAVNDPVIADILGRVPDEAVPDRGERERLLVPLLAEEPLRSVRLLRSTTVKTKYEFNFDRFGNDLTRPVTATDDGLASGDAALGRVREFVALLDTAELSLSHLVRAGILPSTVNEALVGSVLSQPERLIENPSALTMLVELDRITTERAIPLAAMLALVRTLVEDAKGWFDVPIDSGRAWDVLQACSPAMGAMIDRINELRNSGIETEDGPTRVWPVPSEPQILLLSTGVPPALRRVTEVGWYSMFDDAYARIEAWLTSNSPTLGPDVGWDYWRNAVRAWLIDGIIRSDPIGQYRAMVATAAGIIPDSLLKPDLNTMTILDWSRFAAAAFMQDDKHPWAAPSALRALGFAGRWMTRHPDQIGPDLTGEQDGPPGLLLILRSDADAPRPAPRRPAGRPTFAVTLPIEREARNMIDWLRRCGALDGVVNEDDYGQP